MISKQESNKKYYEANKKRLNKNRAARYKQQYHEDLVFRAKEQKRARKYASNRKKRA